MKRSFFTILRERIFDRTMSKSRIKKTVLVVVKYKPLPIDLLTGFEVCMT